ncbi:MAG: hypothetical protein NTX13_14315 [Acidobacteria bacterium]|nr:hypothetical protein [Acidobacteriota bacterium]
MKTILPLFLFSLAALAAPDFSGTWKVNVAKSNFGPMPSPDKYIRVIDHKEPTVKIEESQASDRGEWTGIINLKTDGTETSSEIRGNALKSISRWDGEVLSSKSKLDFNGTPIELNDRLSLSEDKKTLTLQRKIDTPNGVLEQSVVFERQDSTAK